MVSRPLITGFGDRVMWTAGPVSAPLCNSAYWREQEEGVGNTFFTSQILCRLVLYMQLIWTVSIKESI